MATELTDRQLLECAIAAYTAAGWRIVSQTEHGFEAAQPRDLSMLGLGVLVWVPTVIACLVFFVAPMLGMGILALAGIGLLIVLLDYAIQHEERCSITAEQLRAAPPPVVARTK
jgi:energy-converting hydrogenase Eha subunit G